MYGNHLNKEQIGMLAAWLWKDGRSMEAATDAAMKLQLHVNVQVGNHNKNEDERERKD